MSKIMSILEKYSLVEKISKDEQPCINLEQENAIISDEVASEEVYISNVQSNATVVKEDSPKLKSDIEYERIMNLSEIYSLYELRDNNINTVFMLQNLINALPQNLPKDVIKQSVINIINASNIDLNELISDGEQRKEVLVKTMDGYNNETNMCIVKYKEEIAKLSKLIGNYQEQIKIKENMLDEQIHIIKYEAQKINGIIDFFSK